MAGDTVRRKRSGPERFIPLGVSAIALSLVATLVAVSPGFPLRETDLDNAGVWVTYDRGPLYGRVSMTAKATDMLLSPPGEARGETELDIFQDGDSVVARVIATGLVGVDPRAGLNIEDAQVPVNASDSVGMGGSDGFGTIAILNQNSGEIRAVRYVAGEIPDVLGLDSEASDPLHTLDVPSSGTTRADLTVGKDGSIFAASVTGDTVTIHPNGMAFEEPIAGAVAVSGEIADIQVAAVGDSLVVADLTSGAVYLPDGKTATVNPDGMALQQSGPDADSVLASNNQELMSIGFDGTVETLVTASEPGTSANARPVRLGVCQYAAWSGVEGEVVRMCDGELQRTMMESNGPTADTPEESETPADGQTPSGEEPPSPKTGQPDTALVKPEFRVNRDYILLNDLATGRIFDIDLQQSIDEWDALQQDESMETEIQDCLGGQGGAIPEAQADTLGARAGRTTALYVLDNDTGSCGEILSIVDVTAPSQGRVSISPDTQSLLIWLPEDATTQQLTYTIGNYTGETSQATVTVEVHGPTVNSPPELAAFTQREDYVPDTYSVPSHGSVAFPVTGVWRDKDGDPVTVSSAVSGDQSLAVTSQGLVHYSAGRAEQDTIVDVVYQVTDGVDDSTVEGTVHVNVLAYNQTKGVAPEARPDVARGKVGEAIAITPLKNDVPGTDPLHPNAQLELVASVGSVIGVSVTTDLVSGKVTAIAEQPGIYPLMYSAKVGAAHSELGQILVHVTAEGSSSPVAMTDHVTLRGEVPQTIDVLANDVDPAGNVLTVQSVTASDPEYIMAAVYRGRWLTITAANPDIPVDPAVVRYTVTNGLETVEGDVIVTQLEPKIPDRAIVSGDYATVRAGDQVRIPVLDNDASESGAPLVINDNTGTGDNAGAIPAGALEVSNHDGNTDAAVVGEAVVVGTEIFYTAPASVENQMEVTFHYQAGVALQTPSDGVVTVTVKPAVAENNQPPTPRDVEVRGIAGETINVTIPVYGIDADGDSVTVIGLGRPPAYGRVISYSPTALTYEAFPSQVATGSDTFTYKVVDRWGAVGEASVRVGLASPGDVQPPVALDDLVIAPPNAAVTVYPMTNDLIPVGDSSATVAPLTNLGDVPEGVEQNEKNPEVIQATSPLTQEDIAVSVPYTLIGSGGESLPASITIQSRDDYNNPPNVYDHVAISDDGLTASVNVLENAWDIDGERDDLTVTAVGEGGTIIGGDTVHVTMIDRVQAIWYQVTDARDGVSAAVVYVPAIGAGNPYLMSAALIEMDANSTETVDINDYISSPRSQSLRLISPTQVWSAPIANVTQTVISETQVELTSLNDYSGPAALTVEVVDSADPNDQSASRGYVSIPIQVGEVSPVMWCPEQPIELTQGGQSVPVDVTSTCHVWLPPADGTQQGSTLDALTFTSSWDSSFDGVNATSGTRVVSLDAEGTAVPGATGVLRLTPTNYPGVEGTLNVTVKAAAKPTIAIPDIVDVKQGVQVETRLAMQSPLRDRKPTIVSVERISGPAASVTWNGTTIHVTPDPNVNGVIMFRVIASDLEDAARIERHVEGSFTVTVYGVPDAPTPPQPGTALRSRSTGVTFSPGADNGAPITEYRLEWTGGSMSCGLNTSCEVNGLTNGVTYQFRVQACNKAGCGPWSVDGPGVMPNEVPGAVPVFHTSQPLDGSLLLSWEPAVNYGTAVTQYTIAYGGGERQVAGSATSVRIPGLNNDTVYDFTIVAENIAGLSQQTATVTGQSSGNPTAPGVPVISPADMGSTAQVEISWAASAPNGPIPVTYEVTRTKVPGGTPEVACPPVQDLKCLDSSEVTYDGTVYQYSVQATNGVNVTFPAAGDENSSVPSSKEWVAVGQPADWDQGSVVAEPTGVDGQAKITLTYPPSRGARSTVTYTVNGGAAQSVGGTSPNGGTVTQIVNGLPDGSAVPVVASVCNEADNCKESSNVSVTVTTFGPLGVPTLAAGEVSVHKLCAVGTGDGNGANATVVVTANGQTSTSAPGTGPLSTTLCVEGLAEHTTVTFDVKLVSAVTTPARDPAESPGASLQLTTPWETFANPSVALAKENGNPGDYTVCTVASGTSVGSVAATLTVTVKVGNTVKGTQSYSGTGTLGGTQCFEIGAANTTVTATVTLDDGTERAPVTVSSTPGSVKTNGEPWNPQVTLYRDGYSDGFPYVRIVTSGFPGDQSCTIWRNDGDVWLGEWTQQVSNTDGTNTRELSLVDNFQAYGPGSGKIKVTCKSGDYSKTASSTTANMSEW